MTSESELIEHLRFVLQAKEIIKAESKVLSSKRSTMKETEESIIQWMEERNYKQYQVGPYLCQIVIEPKSRTLTSRERGELLEQFIQKFGSEGTVQKYKLYEETYVKTLPPKETKTLKISISPPSLPSM